MVRNTLAVYAIRMQKYCKMLFHKFWNVIAFPRKPCFISFCYVLYGEMATICYFETYFLDDLIKTTSISIRHERENEGNGSMTEEEKR